MAARKYNTPPIEEAICEFRFASSQAWDSAVVEALRSSLPVYDGAPRNQSILQAQISLEPDKAPSVTTSVAGERVQLPTSDGTRLVVGADVLSAHSLRPYDGWEVFRPRILQALQAYWLITKPAGVIQIGLR